MNRRTALPLLGGFFSLTGRSPACLWDRDTLKDELSNNPDTLDLILGQFPHHGKVYYQTRRLRLEKKGVLEVEETNDLAVALVRLDEFEKGMMLLEAQLKKNPITTKLSPTLESPPKNQGTFKKEPTLSHKRSKSNPTDIWASVTGISQRCNGG